MHALQPPPASRLASLGGHSMGTRWSVRCDAPARMDLHALHALVQDALDQVVAQMSTWREDSDISAYNRAPAGTWIALQPAFAQVLGTALAIASASGGAFDPTVGPLVDAWGFGAHGRPGMPDAGTLARAQAAPRWTALHLREHGRQALQPGGLRLDLSAIAKGFGADHAAAALRRAGIPGALVEVGGELVAYGRKPDASPWRVLVETGADDTDAATQPRVLALDGCAVATSGDRWHHFDHNGQRYAHTLDPRSGQPVAAAAVAVTVVARDAMHADAWATALTVMGAVQGLQFAREHAMAARFVLHDNDARTEHMTPAFEALLA